MLSGNSLRQTVHTHRASVHQAAKLVTALLRVARVTAGQKVMTAYRRVYDSRHLQPDCQDRDQLRNHTLGNQVFTWPILVTSSSQSLGKVLKKLNSAQKRDLNTHTHKYT